MIDHARQQSNEQREVITQLLAVAWLSLECTCRYFAATWSAIMAISSMHHNHIACRPGGAGDIRRGQRFELLLHLAQHGLGEFPADQSHARAHIVLGLGKHISGNGCGVIGLGHHQDLARNGELVDVVGTKDLALCVVHISVA